MAVIESATAVLEAVIRWVIAAVSEAGPQGSAAALPALAVPAAPPASVAAGAAVAAARAVVAAAAPVVVGGGSHESQN